MRNLDLTPLFHSTVGFDRLNRMLNAVSRVDDRAPSYPPYDIEKIGDDGFRRLARGRREFLQRIGLRLQGRAFDRDRLDADIIQHFGNVHGLQNDADGPGQRG